IVVGEANVFVGDGGGAFIWGTVNGTRGLLDGLRNDFGLGTATQGGILCVATAPSGERATLPGVGPPPPCRQQSWVARLSSPSCLGDFNHDGDVNPDDIADFIACYFGEIGAPGSCPAADFNTIEGVNPDDIADFLAVYFSPCA